MIRRTALLPLPWALVVALAACGGAASEETSSGVECTDEAQCASVDELTKAVPPFPLLSPKAAKYPIVLHHGFNASSSNSWSYYQVKEALEKDGNFVVVSEVEPFQGVPARAASLAKIVEQARVAFCAKKAPNDATCAQTTKVNLVAHSMGGLDARYLVSALGYGDRVASVTTISSPHRGSAVADAVLGLVKYDAVNKLFSELAGFYGKTFTADDLAKNSDIRAAFVSLSEENAAKFNATVVNDARVYYQSWAGVSRAVGGPRTASGQAEVKAACGGTCYGEVGRADFMAASLVIGSTVVGHFSSAPQDGMVTVENAKWGNFRGCFPSDHLDEVGQVKKTGPDAYTLWDHRVFYRNLATELAARGF